MRARAEACGLSLSAYIRKSALSDEARPVAFDARELKSAYAELRRCGNNANQIAKSLNMHGPSASALFEAEEALKALERAADAVAKTIADARG